jgi:hypothetical protein
VNEDVAISEEVSFSVFMDSGRHVAPGTATFTSKHPLLPLEEQLIAYAREYNFRLSRPPVKYYCELEHSESGAVIYLDREGTRRRIIAVFIHPDTDLAALPREPGLAIPVKDSHSDGMTRFPKKPKNGIRPSTHGYRIRCADLTAFGRLLGSLPDAPVGGS